jgi:hypothetical protein
LVRNLTCSQRRVSDRVVAGGRGTSARVRERRAPWEPTSGTPRAETAPACTRRLRKVAVSAARGARGVASVARARTLVGRLRRPQHQDLKVAHVVLRRRCADAGHCGAQHQGVSRARATATPPRQPEAARERSGRRRGTRRLQRFRTAQTACEAARGGARLRHMARSAAGTAGPQPLSSARQPPRQAIHAHLARSAGAESPARPSHAALSFFRASLCHQLRHRARRALMMRRGSALFARPSAMVDARRANGGEHPPDSAPSTRQARRLGERERWRSAARDVAAATWRRLASGHVARLMRSRPCVHTLAAKRAARACQVLWWTPSRECQRPFFDLWREEFFLRLAAPSHRMGAGASAPAAIPVKRGASDRPFPAKVRV